MSDCKHMKFEYAVQVHRLQDAEELLPKFMLHMKIRCSECNMDLVFLGIPPLPVHNYTGPNTSADGIEVKLAVMPRDRVLVPPDTKELNG